MRNSTSRAVAPGSKLERNRPAGSHRRSASAHPRVAAAGRVPVSFVSEIHNFRGLAIILIVGVHCISVFDWSASPGLVNVLKRVFANSTVYFLFISGFLFQHLSHRFRPREYYWRKTRYVLAPYVIASIPALLLYTVATRRADAPEGLYDHPVWAQVLLFLGTGSHLAPFWYIPALTLIFLVAPLLYWWDRHPRLYALLPALFAVPFFISRGRYHPAQAFVHYLPIYILGMACSRYREPIQASSRRWFWPLAAFAVLMFAAELRFAPGTHSWYSYMQKAALAVVLWETMRRLGSVADHWFGLMGSLAFGIYFVHSYIISAAKVALGVVRGAPPPGGILVFLLVMALTVGICLVLVRGLARLLGPYSRVVLGVSSGPRRGPAALPEAGARVRATVPTAKSPTIPVVEIATVPAEEGTAAPVGTS